MCAASSTVCYAVIEIMHKCVCMYVCEFVCMCVRMHICMIIIMCKHVDIILYVNGFMCAADRGRGCGEL